MQVLYSHNFSAVHLTYLIQTFCDSGSAQQIEAIPLSDLEWDDVPVARGGQAVVFKGRWISRDKTVAIKKPLAADYQEVRGWLLFGILPHHLKHTDRMHFQPPF